MTRIDRIFGSPTSYYTAKVRAYLNYKAIPFEEILSTEEVYRDVIVARTGVWMIPVLITPDDTVVQDSSEIIDALERRFPVSAVCPDTPLQRLTAHLFELFGDEWLIMTAMHYRWMKPENRTFVLSEFGRTARPDASPEEQLEAGLKKASVFIDWVEMFGVDEVIGPAVEEAYEELLAALQQHFNRYDFFLGSRPSIADFSFFGALYAVLHRDPLSGRLMTRLAPDVVKWIGRMLNPKPNEGVFLPDDEVPATLNPILNAVFRDQLPVLRDTVSRVAAWSKEHPGKAFPKTIGRHDFELRGRRGSRCVYPYAQWMLQRVLDQYHSIPFSRKAAIDQRLHEFGGLRQLDIPMPQPVTRSNFRLMPMGESPGERLSLGSGLPKRTD
jgi:glutathione S-transferase